MRDQEQEQEHGPAHTGHDVAERQAEHRHDVERRAAERAEDVTALRTLLASLIPAGEGRELEEIELDEETRRKLRSLGYVH